MRTLLAAALLIGSAIVLIPDATAYPCEVGDSDNVCVNEYSYAYGDCDTGGYESGSTDASGSANGENVNAGGSSYCYYDPSWGSDYEGQNIYLCYSGSQGYACVQYNSFQDNQYGYAYCQVYNNYNVGGVSGYGYQLLDQDLCLPNDAVSWGNLV